MVSHPHTFPACFNRFVGLPWRDRGRDFSGVDCWGLLRLVYLHELGRDLPLHLDDYLSAADRRAIADLVEGGLPDWQPIARGEEQSFNGVLIRCGANASHIGIVIYPGTLLHIEQDKTSVAESYRHGILKNRVLGFYRHNPRPKNE